MNRRFFPNRRVPPAIQIELARRNSSRESDSHYSQNRPPLQNFRINRLRRPFVHRQSELPEVVSHSIDTFVCRYCNNTISLSFYGQHLADCPIRREFAREDLFQYQNLDINGSQRQQEEPNERIIRVEDDSDISPIGWLDHDHHQRPENEFPNNSITYTSEEVAEEIPNLIESVESSVLQPISPENQGRSNNDLFSTFSDILNNSSQENFNVENHNEPPPTMEQSSLPDTSNTQEDENGHIPDSLVHSTQLDNLLDNRNHGGAFVVRTIESGPNGSTIVRMRVIPLDAIFGRQDGEISNIESPGILGFLSMLAGLQGIQTNFVGFLNILHGEKGLDKEALDNLPVVTYTADGFKNVEEESKKCTICLEHYEDQQEVKFLWCLHRFHKNCVDQWLDKHTNCPFCKKDYADALRTSEEL